MFALSRGEGMESCARKVACLRSWRRLHPRRRFAGCVRHGSNSAGGSQDYQLQPGQAQAGPSTQRWGPEDSEPSKSSILDSNGTLFKMFESAATTVASLVMLGLAGYGYHRYYKHLVLQKMENAFSPGDPVLDLSANISRIPGGVAGEPERNEHWYPRVEQAKVDAIVRGDEKGHYYLVVGEKGSGKTSMLIDAMHRVGGEGVSMFEAHADTEIFRIRLGKALDFEYHEDYIGSLFSIRGPRDTTPLLDIERAFNKLDKVALRRRRAIGKPLILIINSMHLLRDNEEGQNLLELIQQRAEHWAASNLVTVILNSDDYWVYERLKLNASYLEVLPVSDLTKERALTALKSYRVKYFNIEPSRAMLDEVYGMVGGRLAYLNRVAKSEDMLQTCRDICQTEKTWFLNQCWVLGEEMDDDVMDQQKYASAAMVLAKALADRQREIEQQCDPRKGHVLPEIPLHEARQIMTRADFIQMYDHVNVFTIDSRAMVRADSVPMQNAFREICGQPGFDEHLEATLDRITAIESLGRTREIVAKDLWHKGSYKITTRNAKGALDQATTVEVLPGKKEDEGS